jgi:Uma2 family endonuclease
MATATTPTMTAEEFFAWTAQPGNEGKRFELENGEVVEMPSPGELHGFVCWLAAMALGNYLFRRGAGYVCTNDTGLIVRRNPDTVRGPDLLVFLETRDPDQMSRTFCDRVPALIVEVFSPSDKPGKLHREADELTGNGVLPDFSCRVRDLFTLPGSPPAGPTP